MIWEITILILSIVSALYAFPYGKWEWSEKNKIGGVLIYISAFICVVLSGIQLFI